MGYAQQLNWTQMIESSLRQWGECQVLNKLIKPVHIWPMDSCNASLCSLTLQEFTKSHNMRDNRETKRIPDLDDEKRIKF